MIYLLLFSLIGVTPPPIARPLEPIEWVTLSVVIESCPIRVQLLPSSRRYGEPVACATIAWEGRDRIITGHIASVDGSVSLRLGRAFQEDWAESYRLYNRYAEKGERWQMIEEIRTLELIQRRKRN